MQSQAKKILKISLIALFFVFIITFIFFNSKDLIFGVKIKNVNLANNMKVSENILNIAGRAMSATKLTLNDREISIDQKGNFNETIALFSGYNVVSIKAQDKFGNNDEKNFRLIGEFAEEAK